MEFERVEINCERWLNLENLLNEEWRDIEGYEGLYKVSNYGRVKNLPIWRKHKESKILKANKNRSKGYFKVTLCDNGSKVTRCIHRLVAKAFLSNHNNLPQINHKDEDKSNNHVDNLEWCTEKYNINFGYGKYKGAEHLRKKVLQFNKKMEFIKEWNSMTEAWRVCNVHKNNIMRCCQGKQKTAGGYIWKYAEINGDEK